jgi:hypothetical protein
MMGNTHPVYAMTIGSKTSVGNEDDEQCVGLLDASAAAPIERGRQQENELAYAGYRSSDPGEASL